MVKLEDGSMVYASQLRSGSFEDANGNKVNFQKVEGSNPETFIAEVSLNDGTGRVEVWTASLADTLVRVGKVQQTQEQVQANRRAAAQVEKQQAQQQQQARQAEEESTSSTTRRARSK